MEQTRQDDRLRLPQEQGSAPDAAGFVDITANFQITGGNGRYNGGGGTLTGVVNFAQSSFSITVKGMVVGAQAGA